ncbi:hypothetical protein BO86DRAFT_32872 [Aspergillus japonicus CBS 114.51]|uniref:Uncharacterized protein n=1 Tax=Aspergillus japonicus CBS 114.51 TaxID=1448312 RepID=A0A8T8X6M1_ASPJA|nr:hypothetical protein BO86DRAFT_32872 [Aspergillus japonicus CBS 114.51]RAH83726.1 hypothetical protein BO86DRAFT_32872 [Aspergillus japonicus CBS 114.51]
MTTADADPPRGGTTVIAAAVEAGPAALVRARAVAAGAVVEETTQGIARSVVPSRDIRPEPPAERPSGSSDQEMKEADEPAPSRSTHARISNSELRERILREQLVAKRRTASSDKVGSLSHSKPSEERERDHREASRGGMA